MLGFSGLNNRECMIVIMKHDWEEIYSVVRYSILLWWLLHVLELFQCLFILSSMNDMLTK